MYFGLYLKIVSEYDQEIPQSQSADNPHGTVRKSHFSIWPYCGPKESKMCLVYSYAIAKKVKFTSVQINIEQASFFEYLFTIF